MAGVSKHYALKTRDGFTFDHKILPTLDRKFRQFGRTTHIMEMEAVVLSKMSWRPKLLKVWELFKKERKLQLTDNTWVLTEYRVRKGYHWRKPDVFKELCQRNRLFTPKKKKYELRDFEVDTPRTRVGGAIPANTGQTIRFNMPARMWVGDTQPDTAMGAAPPAQTITTTLPDPPHRMWIDPTVMDEQRQIFNARLRQAQERNEGRGIDPQPPQTAMRQRTTARGNRG